MHFWQVCTCLLATAISLVFYIIRKHLNYWAERDVVYDKPGLFDGNMKDVNKTQPLKQPFFEFYRKYKDVAPFGGFYLWLRKAVVLFDLELVKRVMITDFNNFSLRANYSNEKDDPITGHLVNMNGPKWKQLRAKLTPTFSSGKIKFMFPTVVDVGERFVSVLNELLETLQNQEVISEDGIGIRELLARFTTDVIGSCAFGLECNSLKDPNVEFRAMGQKAITTRRHGPAFYTLAEAFPDLARKLGITLVPKDVSNFFMNVVKETVEYRKREKVQRNDFMNILIELKNRNDTDGFTIEKIAAQAFVFFLAGFETSSSTMSFALYELAVHQDMQEKVRQEISEVLKKYDNKLTYEGVAELKYLKMVFYETLRKYSIVQITLRVATADYRVPNTKHVIEKGTVVVIPIDAIHHDPAIYPNPSEFIPERFTNEEINKRHSMAWLGFGEGPRNCIGLRFGKMQAMIGLALLLANFKFTLGKKTPVPLIFDEKSKLLKAKGDIYLKLEKIGL